MANPEKLTTLGTKDAGRRQKKQKHNIDACQIVNQIKVITKLPNSEQYYKGKVQTHNCINRQNQSTTGKL